MWLTLVILQPPVVNNFSGMNNIAEPVVIQTLISKSTIKDIDKHVLFLLARLRKLKLYAVLKGPLVLCPAGKLWSLSCSDRCRIATKYCPEYV